MDNSKSVIQLCIHGMQAEAEGKYAEARSLFLQAWDARTGDLDACIAAHYLARHQEDPAEQLRWNELALFHALASSDGDVQGYYPSLYLNMGWSYESLGNPAEAERYYHLAAGYLQNLPKGPYRDTVQDGIRRGLKRIGAYKE